MRRFALLSVLMWCRSSSAISGMVCRFMVLVRMGFSWCFGLSGLAPQNPPPHEAREGDSKVVDVAGIEPASSMRFTVSFYMLIPFGL